MRDIYYNFFIDFEYKKYFFITKTNIKINELMDMTYQEVEDEFESLFYFYKKENGLDKKEGENSFDGVGILEMIE